VRVPPPATPIRDDKSAARSDQVDALSCRQGM